MEGRAATKEAMLVADHDFDCADKGDAVANPHVVGLPPVAHLAFQLSGSLQSRAVQIVGHTRAYCNLND